MSRHAGAGGRDALISGATAVSDLSAQTIAIDRWYSELVKTQTTIGSLTLQRLDSGFYYLKEQYRWEAAGRIDGLERIVVSAGFVTDLSSIPALFWSVLPPKNIYAIPTVLHNYLYWTQTVPRSVADKVFLVAMRDADVDEKLIKIFTAAITAFGGHKWQANATAKKNGERRVLKVVPVESGMQWNQLKAMPNAFLD